MTLYKKITTTKESEMEQMLFEIGHLDWWDLLADLLDNRPKAILYCVYAYDPSSSKLKNVSNRLKDKSDIARLLDIAPSVADKLINNESDSANEFITKYYKEIKDTDFAQITSYQELLELNLEIIRKKSPMPTIIFNGQDTGIADEELFLKTQIAKTKLTESCMELRSNIKLLRKEYDSTYSTSDKIIEDEILTKGGDAEKAAFKYKKDIH